MYVRDLMRPEVITLYAEDTLDLAEGIMRLGRIRHLPVVSGDRVVGIVSQRDLFRAAVSSLLQLGGDAERKWLAGIPVKAVMTIVLVDDGPWWFRLRGASFRGVARRHAEAEGIVWWAVAPRRLGLRDDPRGVMLSPDAPVIREFLRASLVAHVGSRSAAGRPFVTPLWFTPYAGVLWVTTGLDTRLAKNVAHQPEVTLLLWGEARRRLGGALRLRARATRHAGLPPWAVLLRIAARYYLAPGALASELGNVTRWLPRARYYAQVGGGPGHVRLVPLDAEIVTAP